MFLSRRTFLIQSGLASAGNALPSFAQGRRRVLIVGAGAAGLSAAYDLHQAGVDVQVFEAQNRVGGRMLTLREPFSDGLYAEAGAMNLLSTNQGLDYAREFGLELVSSPFDPSLGSLSYFKGQRFEHRPGSDIRLPFDLKPEEQGMTIFDLQTLYYRRPVSSIPELRRMNEPEFPQSDFAHLDAQNMEQFWQEQGASPDAIELMMHRYFDGFADQASDINVLQVARERASLLEITGSYRIAGGNDQICTGLANRLGARVHLNSPVLAVNQTEDGVRLSVEGAGGVETIEGDFVILTPPPPVLRNIELQPAFSEMAMRAINELNSAPATRVFTQSTTRFWEAAGLDGGALTDLPIASIQHSTVIQDGTRGILESFSGGAKADAMAALAPEQRLQMLSDALHTLYPDTAELDGVGASYAWGDNPWEAGALVSFRPSQLIDFLTALQQPQGRVLLAGDTIGGIPGYSNSAFASGKSAAATILARSQ